MRVLARSLVRMHDVLDLPASGPTLNCVRDYARANKLARGIAGLAGDAKVIVLIDLAHTLRMHGMSADVQDAADVLTCWFRQIENRLDDSEVGGEIHDQVIRSEAKRQFMSR